jgi:hypothetical protein
MYRRPTNAGAWGFIGEATPVDIGTYTWQFQVLDTGQDADFSNQPPEFVEGFSEDAQVLDTPGLYPKPKTGINYQNRIIFSGTTYKNKVFASRTDEPFIMTRSYPLQDDDAVSFKTGSDGGAEVGRLYDARGLLITTSRGIYETPSDILIPDTAYAVKRSNVIHDETVPVIGMGSSVFVTDKRLSGVFRLVPAQDGINLDTQEVSVFSAHLLEDKTVKSWAIQDDGTQLLWIVLDDGSLLSFSFQQDQELQSWARHDTSLGDFKHVNVIETDQGQGLFAVVEDEDGAQWVQVLSKKYTDTKAVYNHICTDSTVIFKNQMIPAGETVEYNPATGTLTASAATFTNSDGLGAVGSVFRFFNFDTGEYINLTVTAYTSTTQVTTSIEGEVGFDLVMGSDTVDEMYQTFTELSSVYMGPLNDKEVAIRCDGFTHASPLNNDPNKDYLDYTVELGTVTLPEEYRSAFVSVGLPIVTDIETLGFDTYEENSDREYSMIVNRCFISYYKSRGFYIGPRLPSDDTLTDMDEHEVQYADEITDEINPTKPIEPYTLKQEVTFNGDWRSGGRVALRNVDPQPVGIRGLILDVETGG